MSNTTNPLDGVTSYNPAILSFLVNQNALFLPKWRTAIGKVKINTSNARVLCIGDSTTQGSYSNGTNAGDINALSYPAQLFPYFIDDGINANTNNFMGNSAIFNRFDGDSRIAKGSFTATVSSTSLGGTIFLASNNSLGPMTFKPWIPVDTFVIYYITGVGQGSFNININGGTNTTTSQNVTASVLSVSITGTLGINTLNILWASGAGILILGVEAFDSTKKSVNLVNCGWGGATSTNIADASQVYSSLNAIGTILPDLSLVMIGINDWVNGTSLSLYSTNMQAIVTQCKNSGDVVLISPAQSAATSVPVATQNNYIAILQSLATSNNILYVDVWNRMGLESNNTAMYGNALHPNGVGYSDITQAIYNVIGNT